MDIFVRICLCNENFFKFLKKGFKMQKVPRKVLFSFQNLSFISTIHSHEDNPKKIKSVTLLILK